MILVQPYPADAAERDQWIASQRGPRNPVSSKEPYAFLVEAERFADGTIGDVATIFLTNRECPWRCVMCDLWRNTLPSPVARGDIPRQIAFALERLAPARQVKLYNSGSFFDSGAIPPEDFAEIAALLRGFERVIVECHPALVGERCTRFQDLLDCELEIAMGLETAHPEVLSELNKRMTLEQYEAAAEHLRRCGIALRSFVLVQPPFLAAEEAVTWACRSIDYAQGCGATVVSLIPTRGGNGAMESLAQAGQFAMPAVHTLEDSLDYGIGQARGRVFLDLWDFDRFASCKVCMQKRQDRLLRMNLSQTVEERVICTACGGAS